ncbi:hypothetical protein, partial [Myroides odoratus]|uniref:hypothetical protein n=1 Tax=Myroides odoratus TaxID=256 RepID=UPI001E4729F3
LTSSSSHLLIISPPHHLTSSSSHLLIISPPYRLTNLIASQKNNFTENIFHFKLNFIKLAFNKIKQFENKT